MAGTVCISIYIHIYMVHMLDVKMLNCWNADALNIGCWMCALDRLTVRRCMLKLASSYAEVHACVSIWYEGKVGRHLNPTDLPTHKLSGPTRFSTKLKFRVPDCVVQSPYRACEMKSADPVLVRSFSCACVHRYMWRYAPMPLGGYSCVMYTHMCTYRQMWVYVNKRVYVYS